MQVLDGYGLEVKRTFVAKFDGKVLMADDSLDFEVFLVSKVVVGVPLGSWNRLTRSNLFPLSDPPFTLGEVFNIGPRYANSVEWVLRFINVSLQLRMFVRFESL